MSRREAGGELSDAIYKVLLITPSWVGPVLAAVVFATLRYVLPAFLISATIDVKTMAGNTCFGIAPIGAGIVVFLWILAEIHKFRNRFLLDKQSGLDSIRNLSWQEFEHLVGEAFRRQGYIVQETGSASGDGGIDLSMSKGKERVLVQCKQWRSRRVGVKPVRELFGVMISESADHAILVTCGGFTREARDFAERKPLHLVGGLELWELVKSVKKGNAVSESPEPRSTVLAIPAPPTHQAEDASECPVCSSPMVLRTARKGSNAGSQFWGCSQYPKCRGTRPC